jgi:hypothetical protein
MRLRGRSVRIGCLRRVWARASAAQAAPLPRTCCTHTTCDARRAPVQRTRRGQRRSHADVWAHRSTPCTWSGAGPDASKVLQSFGPAWLATHPPHTDLCATRPHSSRAVARSDRRPALPSDGRYSRSCSATLTAGSAVRKRYGLGKVGSRGPLLHFPLTLSLNLELHATPSRIYLTGTKSAEADLL